MRPFGRFPNSRNVRVNGLKAAQKNMDPELIDKYNRRLFKKIGSDAVNKSRRLVSSRSKAPSGRLSSSIGYSYKIGKRNSELAIGSNLNYAHIQEYGTGSGFDDGGGRITGRVRRESWFPNTESRRFKSWLGRVGIPQKNAWRIGKTIKIRGIEAKKYLRDALTKTMIRKHGKAVGERYWK